MESPLLSYEIEVCIRVGLALCGTLTCRLSPTLTMTVFLMTHRSDRFFHSALFSRIFVRSLPDKQEEKRLDLFLQVGCLQTIYHAFATKRFY